MRKNNIHKCKRCIREVNLYNSSIRCSKCGNLTQYKNTYDLVINNRDMFRFVTDKDLLIWGEYYAE